SAPSGGAWVWGVPPPGGLRVLGGARRLGGRAVGGGPPPWGCAVLGVVHPPGGARPWVWPNPLGDVSRHPPRTVADPPRPRLRQWGAVSAASEPACRRAHAAGFQRVLGREWPGTR